MVFKRKRAAPRRAAPKRRAPRRSKGIIGGGDMSIKSIAFGTVGLIAANMYQPFGGAYKPAVDKLAVGLIGPMIGMGNRDMLSVGVKEGLATLVGGFLGGPTNNTRGGDSI